MKRVRKSGVERRDEISRAALAIIDEQGTGALSIASVAHRVGVAPSALYRHYPDKAALVEDTIERLGAGVRANLELMAAESADDAVAALGAFLNRHVQFVLENRGFPMLIFSDLVLQHPGRRANMSERLAEFRSVVGRVLAEGQRQGRVRADVDPEAGALAFLGLFIPAAIHWHLSGGRTDLAGVVRRAWPIFLAGISASRVPAALVRTPRRAQRHQERPS
jgi:AcrR family transcriptional regulator